MEEEIVFPENPYDDLGFLFWQITKAWQRKKNKILEEFEITTPQMEVMSAICYLSKENEEISQVAISNLTNIDPMTTSTILRNLQRKNLIIRESSKTDTRAHTVLMTNEGYQLLSKAFKKIKTMSDDKFEVVNQEVLKEQFRKLLSVLTEINK